MQVVGCSHHGTSIALRERLAFSGERAAEALDHWRRIFPGVEAVLLSTCNRVELYSAADEVVAPNRRQVAGFLARFHKLDPEEVIDALYYHHDADAIRHLFTVASSLDSMVVGEPQILAQVKQAYDLATHHDNTGPMTHAAFQAALKCARRVACETAIHQRRVSIPSVAVADFASQIALAEAGQREPVIDVGNLSAERDFTDVRDVVRAYYLLATQGEPGEAYNVCSGRAYSIQYLLDTLLSYSRLSIQVRQDPARMRPSDVPRRVGDASALQARTGWQPTIPFEQTLLDILNDWRARLGLEPQPAAHQE